MPKEVYSAEDTVERIVDFIQDKKGKDIKCLDLRNIPEAVADYFIICHADSSTHVKTIADHVGYELKTNLGIKNVHTEGKINGEWILLDLTDIIIHIFQTETREFYQLEDLWSDAKVIEYESM